MRRHLIIVFGVLVLIVSLLVIAAVARRSQTRAALTDYLAELRAQGEALTWEELNVPLEEQTNAPLTQFVAAVSKLGLARPSPARLDYIQYFGPGIATVGWARPCPPVSSGTGPGTNAQPWEVFTADMTAAAEALEEIRRFLEDPPRQLRSNLTNRFTSMPRPPFVVQRTAAQWLAADTMAALHEVAPDRAHADLHALTQLVQMHRDDFSLVTAMIRVAISGLGLSVTWEALQADGWTDDDLSQLQLDWEGIDLVDAMERGMVGERVWTLQIFEQPELMAQLQAAPGVATGSSTPSGFSVLRDKALNRASVAYWRQHLEEDQLFFLKTYQARLASLRRLKTNTPGFYIIQEMKDQQSESAATLEGLLARYRHLLSSSAEPNFSRALEVTLRNETQRRMTITAIALQRYQLKHGCFPEGLDALVPDYASTVPIDPMSGRPFGYRLHSNGDFTLYSMGANGVDDGGDSQPPDASDQFDFWSGRDAVWPTGVHAEPGPHD